MNFSGVILYVILSGTQPFRGAAADLIKQITKAEFVFGGCDWNRMPKAKDLVSKNPNWTLLSIAEV